tara:strand:+ start:1400 stop:1579 length:180 start_codon:yes stop_codon:yes gene_type:complete
MNMLSASVVAQDSELASAPLAPEDKHVVHSDDLNEPQKGAIHVILDHKNSASEFQRSEY